MPSSVNLLLFTTCSRAWQALNHAGRSVTDWSCLRVQGQIKNDSEVKPEKGRLRYLSKEEEVALLAELQGDHYDFVVALLSTGARHTEIAELKWDQVDMKAKTINLYRFKVSNESLIGFTDRFHDVMKRRFKAKSDDQVYVFEDTTGTGSARQYTSTSFKNACKRAGINGVSFHSLRHTAASRCAQAGLSLYEIQMLLGHTTPNMSMKYSHLVPNASLAKAVSVLNTI